MPNRIQTLAALSRETGQRIVSSPEEWQAFLRAAARLYKYPFEEQLLIYAQRPDATACAKIEQWNKTGRKGHRAHRHYRRISTAQICVRRGGYAGNPVQPPLTALAIPGGIC